MDIRIVDGRLTKDAEVKVNKSNGKKFLTFTIANNGFTKGEQTTTFFNIVSYNEFDIERAANFTKGKLVVVSGRSNETMTIKDSKTYLNRNIMAHSIESGTPNSVKENTNVMTYKDVAPVSSVSPVPPVPPVMPTAPYVQNVIPENQDNNPVTSYQQTINVENKQQKEFYSYTTESPAMNNSVNSDDDLPF